MGTKGLPMLDQLGQPFPPVDPRTLAGTATLGLSPRPESVRRARDFTRNTLYGWRLPEQFDAVSLVVSELVTNALRHGLATRQVPAQGPSPSRAPQTAPAAPAVPAQAVSSASPGAQTAAVELELMLCARRLICAVQDPSASAPRVGDMDGAAESGRGLHLVECFSDGWGWRRLTGERRGKVVWAVFQLG
ncbi:ATP-binding protein [Streptomyces hoynatensis]|uniref:ATP-binding protein n=1 Tax=Streptomyces hoynatensis TaxID=1141874 RepID=A0A3A9Z4I5_9ACTN|nr:ATP-binding protein [Streptomyces hoynatensis]RKN42969.1 ATP-binding protein [Streptomyces hoynatensis]